MRILILFASITLASARFLNHNCDGIVVNGIKYEMEILLQNVILSNQLAIDYNTNVLYFTYLNIDVLNYGLAYLNLKTYESGEIHGVDAMVLGCTVDEQSQNVYFGSSNGIYQLNPHTKTASNIGVTDKHTWQLYYKDGLYFTTYPDKEAYLYKAGEINEVTEIGITHATYIGIDNTSNIFFSNSSGLFEHRNSKTAYVGNYGVNGFTSDVSGKLFFSTSKGIYAIDEITKEVKKLVGVINTGAAIESDGSIICASNGKIIRLKSTGKECNKELDMQYA